MAYPIECFEAQDYSKIPRFLRRAIPWKLPQHIIYCFMPTSARLPKKLRPAIGNFKNFDFKSRHRYMSRKTASPALSAERKEFGKQ
jgi:hypothetical protein